jgi:hypothetical protein
MILQAHNDSVRVVVSELKPAKSNQAYHKLGGGDEPLPLNIVDTNVWVLAISEKSSLIVTESDYALPTTITDKNDVFVELDPLVKSIPVTDTFHHLGHEGKVFIHSDRHNDITTNLDYLFVIPAGSATRQIHLRFNYTATATLGVLDVDIILYKDTIVSATGVLEPVVSTNDAVVKSTGVLIYEGPTITDVGVEKTSNMIVGEKRSASSKEQAVPEWVLAPDGVNARNYLLRATVNGGATCDIVSAIFFYDNEAV